MVELPQIIPQYELAQDRSKYSEGWICIEEMYTLVCPAAGIHPATEHEQH
jgi:hypothetical protein